MERLPTEIIEMIGTFVDDKPTQRALTESSVEFHTLFTPRLYSSITLPSIWTPVQFDLIRRLCSSPELASLVRHFAFRIGGYDNYARIWRPAAFRPQPPVHAAPFQRLKDMFLFQNRRQISAQTLLTSQHILYSLCFPALNHVSVCGHFDYWDYEQDLEKCLRYDKFMITNCPVKEVTIWPSEYCNEIIQWFRASTNLERLNLVISQVEREPPEIIVTDYSRQGLLMVKDTLKSLSIQWDERLQQGFRERGPNFHRLKMSIFRLSSLMELDALENLIIPHLNLKGLPDQPTYEYSKSFISNFPASLKTLRITDINFHLITELLLDIVGLVKERTSMPSLECVSLEAFKNADSRSTFCDDVSIQGYLSHNDPRIKGQVRLDLGRDAGLLKQHNALKPYTESYTFRVFEGADHLDAASFVRLASSVDDKVSVNINIQPDP
ncbi:hypothetical protein ASPFODRAFT_478020 [Aspergillus luchuensis CBS 106.47]|uniref:F-box domain-containing protein n=1 Tax=Aspergillus luchuensis (strain CBS 106.47) TaxID=1137211 RepID=A0A1M3TQ72_ASPLC|nr:hypothetical protein ASPFODRAFT_478020 [Aspergillus luchuensis CBS 106.47]